MWRQRSTVVALVQAHIFFVVSGCETQHFVANTKLYAWHNAFLKFSLPDSDKMACFNRHYASVDHKPLDGKILNESRYSWIKESPLLLVGWLEHTQDFMLCLKWIVHVDIWYIIWMKMLKASCLGRLNANPHGAYGNFWKTRRLSRNHPRKCTIL